MYCFSTSHEVDVAYDELILIINMVGQSIILQKKSVNMLLIIDESNCHLFPASAQRLSAEIRVGRKAAEQNQIFAKTTIIIFFNGIELFLFPKLIDFMKNIQSCHILILLIFFSCNTRPDTPTVPKKWNVSTIAGSKDTGFVDGIGTSARFHTPQSLTIDASGNLYVSDLFNFNIRKITTTDLRVSTYAGRSVSNPTLPWGNFEGLVADNSGNIFMIEYDLIYKIQSPTSGYVFAGNLSVQYIDGQGVNAGFYGIWNIAIDKEDNLYLPDYDTLNQLKIRKVTPSGTVSTFAIQTNNVYVAAPRGNYFEAIAVDNSSNIYVTANAKSDIVKITPQGVATILAGSSDTGYIDSQGTLARFGNITGMVIDPTGNIYVSDGANNVIRKVTPDGIVTTIAGTGSKGFVDGDADKAEFNVPFGIVIDKKGIIYVADLQNNCIRKLEYK